MITIKGKGIKITQPCHHAKDSNIRFSAGMQGLWLGVNSAGNSVIAFNLGVTDGFTIVVATFRTGLFEFTGEDSSFTTMIDDFLDLNPTEPITLTRNIKVTDPEQKEEGYVKNV